jgi:hypothetical protein
LAQVPPTAQQFVLDPPADSVAPDSDGLTYHQSQAGALAQGDSRSWTVSYTKPDEALTVGSAQPSATPAAPAGGEADRSTALIFVIAFAALVGVGAGAFWLGRRAQPSSLSSRPGSQDGNSLRLASAHCHACGATLRPDADYCHRCGTKVRKL